MTRRYRRIASPSCASTGGRGEPTRTAIDSAMNRSLCDEREPAAVRAKFVAKTVLTRLERRQHHERSDARREDLFYAHAQVLELGGAPAFVLQHQLESLARRDFQPLGRKTAVLHDDLERGQLLGGHRDGDRRRGEQDERAAKAIGHGFGQNPTFALKPTTVTFGALPLPPGRRMS